MEQDADLGPQHISPRYTVEKISPGFFPDWVDVWEDRLWGWWLAHADALRGERDAGFMIVHIAVGIIETLEVAWQGKDSDRQSARFFGDGFLRLFPLLKAGRVPPRDVATIVYDAVRCGLTHTAMLKGPVFLIDDDRAGPLNTLVSPDQKRIEQISINPAKFLDLVIAEFRRYVRLLREGQGPEAEARRKRFEDAWHLLHARTFPVMPTRPESSRLG